MTRFETIRQELTRAVLSNNVEEKTTMLERADADGYFDGLDSDQVFVLTTIRGDIRRSRSELYVAQAQPVPA
jgi:hypothetical protein